MQSVQQRLPSLIGDPIAFAHRGAKAHAPENTLEAFAIALRLGANGLETDMWRTADGHIVLDHDGIVKRWGRSRPISEVPLTALPSHIPTLEKFYEVIGTDFHFSIDVKDDIDQVSTGTHERFVIDLGKFGTKLGDKAASLISIRPASGTATTARSGGTA